MRHAIFSYYVACPVCIPLGMPIRKPAVKQEKVNKLLIVLLAPTKKVPKKVKLGNIIFFHQIFNLTFFYAHPEDNL